MRRNEEGIVDLSDWDLPQGNDFADQAMRLVTLNQPGFALSPVCYFQFSGGAPSAQPMVGKGAASDSDLVWLVDIDPMSTEFGRRFPLQVQFFDEADLYHPSGILAFGPWDGFMLKPNTHYACLVRKGLLDENGTPVGGSSAWWRVTSEGCAQGEAEQLAASKFSVLTDWFSTSGHGAEEFIAGTQFTTGDPLGRKRVMYASISSNHNISLKNPLKITHTYPDLYVLQGELSVPQFQNGSSPFLEGGGLALDSLGNPLLQGYMSVPVVMTIPRSPMPQGGFPVCIYAHGTGRSPMDLVDRGPLLEGAQAPVEGTGPARTLAKIGFAGVAVSLPCHPERDPEAGPLDAIPVLRPEALYGTLHQGAFELGLLTQWLSELELPGQNLPDSNLGADVLFDSAEIAGFGHSLGSFYMQAAAAIEPRIGTLIISGGGGVWPRVILDMEAVPIGLLVASAAGVSSQHLTSLHPLVSLEQLGLQETDAAVMASGIVRSTDPVWPPRNVLFPAGYHDPFFPEPVQDALARAYAFDLVGDLVREESLPPLELLGGRHLDYPVAGNVKVGDKWVVTAAMTQHLQDELETGHMVTHQIPGVAHQWAHFLRTALYGGVGEVIAPVLPR